MDCKLSSTEIRLTDYYRTTVRFNNLLGNGQT